MTARRALVFEVDPSTQADPLIRAPAYRLVSGSSGRGPRIRKLYGELKASDRTLACPPGRGGCDRRGCRAGSLP